MWIGFCMYSPRTGTVFHSRCRGPTSHQEIIEWAWRHQEVVEKYPWAACMHLPRTRPEDRLSAPPPPPPPHPLNSICIMIICVGGVENRNSIYSIGGRDVALHVLHFGSSTKLVQSFQPCYASNQNTNPPWPMLPTERHSLGPCAHIVGNRCARPGG